MKFLRVAYSILIVFIFLACTFFSDINYACKINYDNPILFIYGLIVLLAMLGLSKIISSFLDKHKVNQCMLVSVPALFFIFQVYAVSAYYFYTNWDVKAIITISDDIARNPGLFGYGYLSKYPNNSLLAWFFSLFFRLVYALHGESETAYQLILLVQCALNSLTGFLLVLIIKRLFNEHYLCIFGYILYVFIIGLSPWVSIPYSDSMGLFFPVLILYILQNITIEPALKFNKDSIRKWFWICVLVYIGYCIKPQIILCWLAFVYVKWRCSFIDGVRNYAKSVLITILCIATGFIYSAIMVHLITGNLYQSEKSFGVAHYLMMGMNTKSGGVFNWPDVIFSESFGTNEERRKADLAVVNSRIKTMGALGVIRHFYRKTLTNFNDGTFWWGGEGDFYNVLRNTDNKGFFSYYLRNIYYNGKIKGIYNDRWSGFVQSIWLSILCFSCFAAFPQKADETQLIVISAIIGLFVFLLLFEARARYLYVYSPYFIIASLFGVHNILNFSKRKINYR